MGLLSPTSASPHLSQELGSKFLKPTQQSNRQHSLKYKSASSLSQEHHELKHQSHGNRLLKSVVFNLVHSRDRGLLNQDSSCLKRDSKHHNRDHRRHRPLSKVDSSKLNLQHSSSKPRLRFHNSPR